MGPAFVLLPLALKMTGTACTHASFLTFKAFLNQPFCEKHYRCAFTQTYTEAYKAYTTKHQGRAQEGFCLLLTAFSKFSKLGVYSLQKKMV